MIPQHRAWLLVALLLAACGGEGNVTTDTEAADPPRTPTSEMREESPGGGGSAQVALTGGQTAAPSYIPTCLVTPAEGVRISMAPEGDGPSVEIRVVDFTASGKYRGTARVWLPGGEGTPRESAGAVDVQLNSQPFAEKLQSGTLFSGSFSGVYAGGAGSGNLSGRFERCFYEYLAPS